MSTDDQPGSAPTEPTHPTTSGGAFDDVPWGASSAPTPADRPALVTSPGSSFLSTDRTSPANGLTPQHRTARTIARVVGPVLLLGGITAVLSGFASFGDDSFSDSYEPDSSEVYYTDSDGTMLDDEGNPLLDEDGNQVTEDEWIADGWTDDDSDTDEGSDGETDSSDATSMGLFISGGVAAMIGLGVTSFGWSRSDA